MTERELIGYSLLAIIILTLTGLYIHHRIKTRKLFEDRHGPMNG